MGEGDLLGSIVNPILKEGPPRSDTVRSLDLEILRELRNIAEELQKLRVAVENTEKKYSPITGLPY